VESSQLRPVIDVVLPFDEFPKGFERMAKHDQFGKIVISIASAASTSKESHHNEKAALACL